MATDAPRFLDAALEYAAMGWRVLPISPRGKVPLLKDWQTKATTDEDAIIGWWESWPDANVGVALGEGSGIIDIETDSEAEEQEYLALFNGDPPPTCCYQAARGKHRLYQFSVDLPHTAVVKLGTVGVRIGNDGKGAQSVMPPSIHKTGKQYTWLVPPSECPPAPIPDEVLTCLANMGGATVFDMRATAGKDSNGSHKTAKDWDKILEGSPAGHRNEDMAAYCGKLLRGASDLTDALMLRVLYQSVEAVNSRNSPPLSNKELETIFKSILRTEEERRLSADMQVVVGRGIDDRVDDAAAATASTDSPPADGGKRVIRFMLTIVHADPPYYLLSAPQFSSAKGGAIRLNAEQMNSPRSIRIEALRQANCAMPKDFDRAWTKKDGLYERLVAHAEHREAAPEDIRHLVVANMLLEQVLAARPYDSDRITGSTGQPYLDKSGDILFTFEAVLTPMRRSDDKIERRELSMVLEMVGCGMVQRRMGDFPRRMRVLTPDGLLELTKLCRYKPADSAVPEVPERVEI
jgi:hypothetical protein